MQISNILRLYLVHSMYDGFLCTRATKEGKNVNPTEIPTKSHSVAVFVNQRGYVHSEPPVIIFTIVVVVVDIVAR
jgi:hypothetical protein